ncbi:hypothetical protein [Brachybacterium phenoliresistens]|uniref:hypothetical protein n=1 Tax=Brachybacterium phenoliresistens TaxID=396014 RepID=UPI0031D45387
MKKHDIASAFQKMRTNAITWIIGIALTGIGVLAFVAIGLWLEPDGVWSRILSPISGALLTTGLISLGWELASRRAFADELDRRYNLKQDIRSSGLLGVGGDWQTIIDWDRTIESASTIEVAIAYSGTWFTSHENAFRGFLASPGNSFTCFIADRTDSETVAQMVSRFPSREAEQIEQSSSLTELRIKQAARDTVVEPDIIRYKRPLDFALYRFDDMILVTLYGRGGKHEAFPVMTFDLQGSMGRFFKKELDSLRSAQNSDSKDGVNV